MEHIHSHCAIQCFCIFIVILLLLQKQMLYLLLLFFVHPPTLGNIHLLSVSADVPTVGISDHMQHVMAWNGSLPLTYARANHIVANNTSLISVAKYLTIWTDICLVNQRQDNFVHFHMPFLIKKNPSGHNLSDYNLVLRVLDLIVFLRKPP